MGIIKQLLSDDSFDSVPPGAQLGSSLKYIQAGAHRLLVTEIQSTWLVKITSTMQLDAQLADSPLGVSCHVTGWWEEARAPRKEHREKMQRCPH